MSARSAALRQRLAKGETALGAWLSITDPGVAEMMAHAGLDYVMIDTEHAPWSLPALQAAMIAFNGSPTVPIVRVAWNDQVLVKQALDLGAEGIVAPMVRTVEEARSLIAACRYPPDGNRGFGPRRASGYGRDIEAYMATANDDIIVIPQIEDIRTLEEIDAYLSLPGLGGVCIGPNDLSGSARVLRQHDHPVVKAAIDRILERAKAHGIAVCTGITIPAERQKSWTERGATLALVTSDVELLVKGCARAIAEVRAALEA